MAEGRHDHRPARFLAVGEQGLAVELGEDIDEEVNARVHLLAEAVRRELTADVLEAVPTYRSLLLFFDPLRTRRSWLVARVEALLAALPVGRVRAQGRLVRVPVCYGGDLGPDLEFVARHNGLTPPEVIAAHGAVEYRVYMLGFTPGFPYLGGMSPRIAAPRLDRPRPRIPAGTVGIAGRQTGIYPLESPGGWRLIGRTPLRLFDATRAEPFLVAAGDRVRFDAVDLETYHDLERRMREGVAGAERPAGGGGAG
jgi:inhibitor of KinA